MGSDGSCPRRAWGKVVITGPDRGEPVRVPRIPNGASVTRSIWSQDEKSRCGWRVKTTVSPFVPLAPFTLHFPPTTQVMLAVVVGRVSV